MSPTEHTLDDLVQATGFSKRQIRFYITKKLVPGAGPSRGPHATYGEETLQRLRLIALLKEKRIEPTGRAMSLDEIGHALDTLSADGIEALLAGRAELAILDTDSGARLGTAPDTEPLAGIIECREWEEPPLTVRDDPAPHPVLFRGTGGMDDGRDALAALFGGLHDLLAAAVGGDLAGKEPGATLWRRAGTPLVEFHVRQPGTPADRARLQALARALDRLLTREDDHDLDP